MKFDGILLWTYTTLQNGNGSMVKVELKIEGDSAKTSLLYLLNLNWAHRGKGGSFSALAALNRKYSRRIIAAG